MLFKRIPVTAPFLSLLLKSVISSSTHDSTTSKASNIYTNSSISTVNPTIKPTFRSNSSTILPNAVSPSANGLEIAAPQSSTSQDSPINPVNSTPVQEYSFTYPGYVAGSYIQVSYKDTIKASWISVPPEHPPNLLIQCWDRNTTTSSTYVLQKPVISTTLATNLDSMTSNFQIPLTPYKDFSPCQLLLQDFNTTELDGGVGTANSSAFLISTTNSSAGQTWSLKNLAPAVKGAVGTGDAGTDLKRLGTMGYVSFLGVLIASVWVA